MKIFLKLVSLGALPAAIGTYCPNGADLNTDYGDSVSIASNGSWTISGSGRVSSKTSFNLLGGSVSFTLDLSQVADGVNTNFYTSSTPVPNTGSSTYCDIQVSNACMELDIIENNGQCGMATTIHTFATDGLPNNQNCDRWGCVSFSFLPDDKVFTVRSEWSETGDMTVFLNGVENASYSPLPSHDR